MSLAFLMAPRVSSQYVYPSFTEGQMPLDFQHQSAAQWTVVPGGLEGDLGSRCQKDMLQRLVGDFSGSPANLPQVQKAVKGDSVYKPTSDSRNYILKHFSKTA